MDRLHAKEAEGVGLPEQEAEQVKAIIRVARRGVHREAGERRLKRDKTIKEPIAELQILAARKAP